MVSEDDLRRLVALVRKDQNTDALKFQSLALKDARATAPRPWTTLPDTLLTALVITLIAVLGYVLVPLFF